MSIFRYFGISSVLTISLLIASCGGPKPLTDEQKARLAESVQDISATGGSVRQATSKSRGVNNTAAQGIELMSAVLSQAGQWQRIPAPIQKMFAGYLGLEVLPSGLNQTFSSELPKQWSDYRQKRQTARDEKLKKIESAMESRFDDKSCSVPESDLDVIGKKLGSIDPSRVNFKFRIAGDNCPIYAEFTVKGQTADANSFDGKFGFVFEVKDAELQSFSEVKRVQLDMSLRGHGNPSEDNVSANFAFEMKGSVLTATEGEIKMNSEAEMEKSLDVKAGRGELRMEVFVGLEFKDFEAQLKMTNSIKVEGAGKQPEVEQSIKLNGEKVTEKDLKALFDVSLGGAQQQEAAPNQPGMMPSMPNQPTPDHG